MACQVFAVGVDVVADLRVVAVLRGHSDAELAEARQVGVVSVAATAVGALGRREEIVVVDLELAGPADRRMVLVMGDAVKGPPRLGGIALMHVQPAPQRHGLARRHADQPPRRPRPTGTVIAGEAEPRGLVRGGEDRHPPRARGMKDVHGRRQQQCSRCALGGEARHRFEIVAGEIRLADVLIAILEKIGDPQRREPIVARTTGRGQRDVHPLRRQFRPRLKRGQELDLDLLGPIRLVADREGRFEQVLARRVIHEAVLEFDVERPEPGGGARHAEPDGLARTVAAEPARGLHHAPGRVGQAERLAVTGYLGKQFRAGGPRPPNPSPFGACASECGQRQHAPGDRARSQQELTPIHLRSSTNPGPAGGCVRLTGI